MTTELLNRNARVHECSIIGCPRVTLLTRWADPRDRWMLEIPLKEDDGTIVIVNLCPVHAREQFNLHERDFVELEKAERMIAEFSPE